MNMISTGSFLSETGASNKQSELVKKLTAAWEKKNSKTARAGGASLMALSLAACGGEDNTPFAQSDIDAAVAAAEAPLNDAVAAAEAAQAAAEADAAEALVAQAAAEADAAAALVAQAAAEADAAAALVAQSAAEADAAAALVAQSAAEADAAAATVAAAEATAAKETAEAALATAQADLATAQAALETKTAEYDALVVSNNTLQGQYDALVAPQALSLTAATTGETLVGRSGADTFSGDKDSIDGADTLIDATSGDGDTANLTFNGDLPQLTITNVENVNVTVSSTAAASVQTVDATNFSGVETLTITKGDVEIGGTTLAGNKAIIVNNLGVTDVAKVVAGTGTTTFNAVQTVAKKAGMTFDVNNASGNVDITGASTITATGQGTGDSMTVQVLSNATEDAKAVDVTTGAEDVIIGAFTGTINVNAATAKSVDLASAAGGATIVAAGEGGTTGAATTGIDVTGIDDSGVSITTSYAGTTAAPGAIQITGSGGSTDTATISSNGVNNLDNDGTLVESLTLSGNTSAATFTNTDLIATTVTISGSQNVTYADSAADFDGVTVTDSSSATSTITLNGAVGGAEDLSKIVVDNINVTADLSTTSSNTIKVANNATVTLSKDQASGLYIDGKTAKDDLNIATGDDTAASGAVIDISTTTFDAATNFDAVSLDATVGKFTATTTTLATDAVLTVTGTKDVALGNLTAKELNAAGSTGKISLDTNATALTKIATGSNVDTVTVDQAVAYDVNLGDGNNVLTIAAATGAGGSFAMGSGDDQVNLNDADSQVVVTGGGNDTVTLAANLSSDSIVVMGDGTTDTFVFSDTNGQDLSGGVNFALTGVEVVSVAALTSGTIKISAAQFAQDNAFKLTGNATTDTLTITNTGTAGATIDASNVTHDSTQASTLILEGKALLADNITGSAKNDTITGTTGGDNVDGGLGTDTFLAANLAGASIEGTNTGTATGVAVNLGLTAITNTTILGSTTGYTADTVTSVGSGQVAYVFGSASSGSTVNSAKITTLSNVENITGTGGKDYIVGSSSANVLEGGAGADVILAGAGNDTVVAEDTDVNLDGGADTDTISLAADASFAGDTFDNFETFVATANGADLTVDLADFTDFTTVTGVATGAAVELIKTTISAAGTVDLTAITFTDAGAGITTAGTGAVTINSGTGNDVLTLGSTGINTVVFQDTNGTDTVTGFAIATDLLDFQSVTANGTIAEAAITNDAGTALGATTLHAANTTVYVIDTDATELGSATAAAITDFADMSVVAAFLNSDDGVVASGTSGKVDYFSINDADSNLNYIYKMVDDGDSTTTIEDTELSLIASIDVGSTNTLTTTETVI